MGWIQKKISKYVDPQPEVVEQPKNINITRVDIDKGKDSYSACIGANFIRLLEKEWEETLFAQDFDKGNLSFLKNGIYDAGVVRFQKSKKIGEEIEVRLFRGAWKAGQIDCKEFIGSIESVGRSALNGVFVQENAQNTVAHLGVSITGEISYPGKQTKSGVDDTRLFFGFAPYNPMTLNNKSASKQVSIHILNTGQRVSIKTDKDVEYIFEVVKSCKDRGDGTVVLKELTHEKNQVAIHWQDVRRSLVKKYDYRDFDSFSNVIIGEELKIPKLFEGEFYGKVVEIQVINEKSAEKAAKKVVSKKQNSNFIPQKLKV